jgi:hypothetical protein
MPKYIVFVFSWETPSAADAEARSKMTVLTADAAGKKIVIEQTAVLKDSTELAEFVRQHKLAKSHAVAVLSRSSVEVCPMLFLLLKTVFFQEITVAELKFDAVKSNRREVKSS